MAARDTRDRSWFERLFRGVPDLSAGALGLFRIAFGALLFMTFRAAALPESPFPPELHRGVWLSDWGWVHALASRPDLIGALEALVLVALASFTIGLLTRPSYAVVAGGLVVWMLVRTQHIGSHGWGAPFLGFLCLLPCPWGDALSIDEMLRRWRGRPARSDRRGRAYGYGTWLPLLALGTACAAAAFAKLQSRGVAWILTGAVKYHFVSDSRAAPVDWGLWVATHHEVAVLLSFFAIAAEATLIVAAFVTSPWVRALFGLAALGLFSGFYLFQAEFWPAWWVLFLGFLPWGPIYERLASWLPAHVALVDGDCPLCRRTARIWHGLDVFDRLRFLHARDERARQQHLPSASLTRLLADMHVVQPDSRAVASGYAAYLRLARSVPLLWPALPVAVAPPVRWLGEAIYRRVADSRATGHRCQDDVCADAVVRSDSPPDTLRAFGPALGEARIDLRLAQIAVAVFLLVQQGVVSGLQLEGEPFFSSFDMYSTTYASTDAFDAANAVPPRYRFLAEGPDGTSKDVTGTLDALPEADVILRNAILQLAGGTPLSPEQREQVRQIAALYRQDRGEPFGRVTLLIDQQAFDWERGRFYWKRHGEPIGALDVEALAFLPPAGGTSTRGR